MTRKITLGAVKLLMILAMLACLIGVRMLLLTHFRPLGFLLLLTSATIAFICFRILSYSDENEIRFRSRKPVPPDWRG
jgi:hypothetical protein